MATATGVGVATDPEPRLLAALLDLALGEAALRGVPFSEVARHAARMLGGEVAGVMRFLGDERAVIVGVWREDGIRAMPINAELDFDQRNSALGRARSTRLPARADSYEGLRGELPVIMEAIGVRASVAAPVLLDERVWGAVVVSTAREEPLPAESEERLATLAGLVGQAVAGGEARQRLEASRLRIFEAADDARRRLERELHEGPRQHLLALLLKLRVALSMAGEGTELEGLLDDATADATDADESLRDLARRLYPVILSERGLAAAVQGLALRAAVPVSLRGLPGRRFPAAIEATAYFVVAEALARVGERAEAGEAFVLLAEDGDRLTVEVRDDDGGADRASLEDAVDRVVACGGRLDVDSAPGGGTVVRAQIPLKR
jgi:signal transduction histidine kinase